MNKQLFIEKFQPVSFYANTLKLAFLPQTCHKHFWIIYTNSVTARLSSLLPQRLYDRCISTILYQYVTPSFFTW